MISYFLSVFLRETVVINVVPEFLPFLMTCPDPDWYFIEIVCV